jgi:hypothetical protein
VTLVDLDAGVAFLPDVVQAANAAQSYYSFQVALIPLPAGYIRVDPKKYIGEQTYLPWLREDLESWKTKLNCDYLCVLTKNMISTKFWGFQVWNFFASPMGWRGPISGASTFGLRAYAGQAGVSFAKACFCLALSNVLYGDKRWRIWPHRRTYGCFFDLCWNRADIMVALKKMKFDHQECREKIKDAEQLKAIDALLALELGEPETPEAPGSTALETE